MAAYGWRETMLAFAAVLRGRDHRSRPCSCSAAPVAPGTLESVTAGTRRQVLGLRPNTVQALLCIAGFCCCVPMSMPQGHLVAFCSDLGISAGQGAAMLSVLLGSAFVSRQFWGWLADRVGGLQDGARRARPVRPWRSRRS